MDYLSKNTYAENITAAEHFLKMADEYDLGRRWNIVASIIFCAFSIEAYLNHIGEAIDGENWIGWDKNNHPSPKEKLDRLVPHDIDFNNEPFSEFSEIFQLRNMVAHGRPVTVEKAVRKPQNNLQGALNNLSSEFESRTTLNKAKKILGNTKSIIAGINDATIKTTKHELWRIENGSLRTS